jgi:hypothetical protein
MIPVVLIAKNDADCNIETRPFPSEYSFYVKMTTPATDFICKAQHDLLLSLASLIIHVSIILKTLILKTSPRHYGPGRNPVG